MPKETEIKLRVTPETLAALRQHPLLAGRSRDGWQTHLLCNQYYDTPEHDLARNRVALRLRRDGEQVIQTLKSQGQSVAGLSERNEWDWLLTQPELDFSLLDDQCWPAALAGLDRQRLQPVFSTDFNRDKADLSWDYQGQPVTVEAALDQGKVLAGSQEEALCELELELRTGDPAALLELACALAADLPLMPCDISKAERGYRLYDADSYSLNLPVPDLPADLPLDEAFTRLAWQLLGNSQRLAEQYRFNGHWRLLEDWVQHLGELRALLSSPGQAVPRASSSALRSALDALLADWRPLVQSGLQDEQVRRAAPQRFASELDQPRWGQFSLGCSAWLLRQAWQTGRNERGQKLGQSLLGKWLPRMLADESRAMALPHYLGRPGALGEQLPRLERLLVWLRPARAVLDLPETDRLYGELHSLHQQLLQKVSPEELQTRLRTLLGLAAWKQLQK